MSDRIGWIRCVDGAFPLSRTPPDPSIKLRFEREETNVKKRLFRLLEQHQRIDEELRRESGRRWPDVFRVMKLKKMKLSIKDRLNRLTPRLEAAR
jgi:hypothetical protein